VDEWIVLGWAAELWASRCALDGTTGDAAAEVAASAVSTRTMNTIRNMTGVSGEP
jgi:hypothetical protein